MKTSTIFYYKISLINHKKETTEQKNKNKIKYSDLIFKKIQNMI